MDAARARALACGMTSLRSTLALRAVLGLCVSALTAPALVACDGADPVDGGADSDGGPAIDAGPPSDDAGAPSDDAGSGDGPFVVVFDTSAGPIAIEVNPAWAPLGAARVREAVEAGFYDGSKFFRVVPGFVVQFGIAADPAVSSTWRSRTIQDDPVIESNTPGTVVFATSGPNTRTTQLFINYADNSFLDGMGFAPFGRVIEGMDNANAINSEYGEMPQQSRIQSEGNSYLEGAFPRLTSINSATIR